METVSLIQPVERVRPEAVVCNLCVALLEDRRVLPKRLPRGAPVALESGMCQDRMLRLSGEVTLNYIEQEIVLETETAYGSDIPLSISSPLLRRLEETARPCVRMVLEGTSASVGAPPAWLERASDVRTVGFSKRNGQSVLHVKAPKLGDAVPEIFDQATLWPGLAVQDDTAIQLIGKVSHAVRSKEASSDLYDRPLLKHLSHWRKLFRNDLQSVAFPANSVSNDAADVFDGLVSKNALLLSDQTPTPRQIRVVGKLDMVRHSTRSFGLLLSDGQEVRGILNDGDPDLLQQYFGKEITIFGKAVYRPSGSLLRIDTQEILDKVEGRSAFSVVPPALTHHPKPDRKIQTSKNGVSAFFGTWPGNETDEELLAALGELRR